ncbi:MAG: ribbon-helix-helix protein, CopG family [Actinomycetota bacterium]|nr:ribbon-helix-helix protein, CopG family [Actinomycetota bacterium]
MMRWDQLLHVRVDGELAATLRRLADENRSTVSQIVRRALAEHAAKELWLRDRGVA